MLELNNIYNMDCMEGMAQFPDKYFDLAIVDPPYGLQEHGGKNRGSIVHQKNGSSKFVPSGDYERLNWDYEPANEQYFKELFRVSKHQIIWGANYFGMAFGPGRIVWDKCNQGSDQSACEIAYNSLTNKVDLIRYMWRGMMQGKSITEGHIQQGNKKLNEKRRHPTHKPSLIYKWILNTYAENGWIILDTGIGSGSLIIACIQLGFTHIGFEKELPYYQEADNWRSQILNASRLQL
jgi:site-specific DNA-methyltransferase (adenine-specific)